MNAQSRYFILLLAGLAFSNATRLSAAPPAAIGVLDCLRDLGAASPHSEKNRAIGNSPTSPAANSMAATAGADRANHGATTARSNDIKAAMKNLPRYSQARFIDAVVAGAGPHGQNAVEQIAIETSGNARVVTLERADRMSADTFGAPRPELNEPVVMTASGSTFVFNPELNTYALVKGNNFQMVGLPRTATLPSTVLAWGARQSAVKSGNQIVYGAEKVTFTHRDMVSPEEAAKWPKDGFGQTPKWMVTTEVAHADRSVAQETLFTNHAEVANGLGEPVNIGRTEAEIAFFADSMDQKRRDSTSLPAINDAVAMLKATSQEQADLMSSKGYVIFHGLGYTNLVNHEHFVETKKAMAEANPNFDATKPNLGLQRGPVAGDAIMKLLGFEKIDPNKTRQLTLADYRLVAHPTAAMLAFRKSIRVVLNADSNFEKATTAAGETLNQVTFHGDELVFLSTGGYVVKPISETATAHSVSGAGSINTGILAGGLFGKWAPILENVRGNVENEWGVFAGLGSETNLSRKIIGMYRPKLDARGKPVMKDGKIVMGEQVFFKGDSGGNVLGVASHNGGVDRNGKALGPLPSEAEQVGLKREALRNLVKDLLKDADVKQTLGLHGTEFPPEELSKILDIVEETLYPKDETQAKELDQRLATDVTSEIVLKFVANPKLLAYLQQQPVLLQHLRPIITEAVEASRKPANDSPDSILQTYMRTRAAAKLLGQHIAEEIKNRVGTTGVTSTEGGRRVKLEPGTHRLPEITLRTDADRKPYYTEVDRSGQSVHRIALENQFSAAIIGALENKIKVSPGTAPGAIELYFSETVQRQGPNFSTFEVHGTDADSAKMIREALSEDEHFKDTLDGLLRLHNGALKVQIGFRDDGRYNPIRTRLSPDPNSIRTRIVDGINGARAKPDSNNHRIPDPVERQAMQMLPLRQFPSRVVNDGKVDQAASVKERMNYIRNEYRWLTNTPLLTEIDVMEPVKKLNSGHLYYVIRLKKSGEKEFTDVATLSMYPNGEMTDLFGRTTVDGVAPDAKKYSHDKALNTVAALQGERLVSTGLLPHITYAGQVEGRSISHFERRRYVMIVQEALGGAAADSPKFKEPPKQLGVDLATALAKFHETPSDFKKSHYFNDFIDKRATEIADFAKMADRVMLRRKMAKLLNADNWKAGSGHGALTLDNIYVSNQPGKAPVRFAGAFRIAEGRHPLEDIQTFYDEIYARYPTEAAQLEKQFRDAYLAKSKNPEDPMLALALTSKQSFGKMDPATRYRLIDEALGE